MSNLKYYNDSTGQWEYLVIGKQGPTGETGAQGPAGLDGNDGALSTNYVINGSFAINQRQVISTTPSVANGYVIDRWTLRRRNVGTHDVSLLENEDIADLGRSNAIKISNFFDSAWIGQRIELNTHSFLSEQDVTVSFYAKADNPISDLRVFLHANSDGGTHGSPYFTTAQPVGTTWERYSFTMTIGTLANDQANSSLLLGLGQQNTDTAFYLSGVQLELGTVATPFKQRPYYEELAACQRYYQRLSNWFGFAEGTSAFAVNLPFVNPMRNRSGSTSAISGATLSWRTTGASDGSTTSFSVVAPTMSTTGLWLLFTGLSGLTDNQAYMSRLLAGTTGGEVVEVDNEL